MLADLVRTTTRDGLRLDGALHASAVSDSSSARCDALLCLHGVGSNFYAGSLFEEMLPQLQALGVAVLWANTRGHDGFYFAPSLKNRLWYGAAFEVVDECRHDVAAWLAFLAERGYQRLGILGHSLGAIKAAYSQATEPHAQLTCLVAASPPRTAYSAYAGGSEKEKFLPMLAEAEKHVAAGRGETLLTVRFPSLQIISAAAYVDKYGPTEQYAIVKHAARLPCPALFTYGELELRSGGSPFAGLDAEIANLECTGVKPEVTVISSADHMYTGRRRELGAEVARWLRGG